MSLLLSLSSHSVLAARSTIPYAPLSAIRLRVMPSSSSTRSSSSSVSDDAYQILEGNELPTDLFQKSLPRLPIPTIENTCRRYLAAQRPLLNDKQFAHTKNAAVLFQQGVGRDLQDLLRKRDKHNRHTSYIAAPWFHMYLSDRRPLVLNYNPYLSFVDESDAAQMAPTVRATNMIVSALRFRRALLDNTLAPEVFHLNAAKSDTPAMRRLVRWLPRRLAAFGAYWYQAFPLDMSQFSSLFASTRVPHSECDTLQRSDNSRHILVLRNGHMYVLDALDDSGAIKSARDIYASVKEIAGDNRPADSGPQLGYLTAENRSVWAAERQHLIDTGNAEYIQLIDSALFVIALDDAAAGSDDHRVRFRQFLHGDAANRWYDKSFTMIVAGDGRAAVNFEHAWGDGVAVLRFFNEVHRDSIARRFVAPHTEPGDSCVRRLDAWSLDARSTTAIDQARQRFNALVNSLDVGVVHYRGLGKDLCKQRRLSPDALMQMAFQVAYHRLTGTTTASYESCSTSAFLHGRTETIRPATEATLQLSRAMNAPERVSNAGQLMEMVRECSRVHGELTVNAAKGQGCDRHLFALRLLAHENSPSYLPEIYADPAFAAFNRFRLSTSTLSSPAAEAGGFGAVEPDGFGVGYMIKKEELGALISAYPQNSDLNGFVDCLQTVFGELHQLISNSQ